MNKKGQDLSIGTLILIVLGIVVLVILVLGFSLGWENLWNKINIFGGTSSVGDVVTACRLAITSQDKYTYCQKSWSVKVDTNGDGTTEPVTVGCRDPTYVTPSLEGGLTCQEPYSSATPDAYTTACKAAAAGANVKDGASCPADFITVTVTATAPAGKVCCQTIQNACKTAASDTNAAVVNGAACTSGTLVAANMPIGKVCCKPS